MTDTGSRKPLQFKPLEYADKMEKQHKFWNFKTQIHATVRLELEDICETGVTVFARAWGLNQVDEPDCEEW